MYFIYLETVEIAKYLKYFLIQAFFYKKIFSILSDYRIDHFFV